jgi:heme/copper-type cytochrome/quinol oxidase subunit 4
MFYEKQHFNRWWIWTMLIVTFIAIGYGILSGKADPSSRYSLLAGIIVIAVISSLLYFTHLETRIDEAGITLRFFPFQRVYYYVKWSEIKSIQLRKYKPIREYGGWGIRFSFTEGKAYTIKGDEGIQLVLNSGKKFLIGTQKTKELRNYLEEIKISFNS